MKKMIMVAAALAWASTASAKHERNNQTCYDCHTMHASISHNYGDAGTFTGGSICAGGTCSPFGANGYVKLLQRNGTNATCLGCHNGVDTDVYGADNVTYLGFRSGGGLNGAVDGLTLDTGYADYMGHTLGSMALPPGFSNAAAWPTANDEGLTCAKCHAVHGGAPNAFRWLGGVADMGWEGVKYSATNPFLTAYPTKNPGTIFDPGYDVTVLASGGNGSRDVRRVVYGVGTNNANGANGLNRYCAVCHGNFHGAANTGTASDVGFRRHPTSGETRNASAWFVSGAQVGGTTTATAVNAVVRPVWVDAAGTQFQVGCTTCHKAHGNKHAFGLIWPTNSATVVNAEEGDGGLFQDLCATCHVQAQTTAYRGAGQIGAGWSSSRTPFGGYTPADTFVNGVKP